MEFLRLNSAIGYDILRDVKNLLSVHSLTLEDIRSEGGGVKTFIFSSAKPIRFKPGQYGVWILKQPVKGKPGHLFSIASAPEDDRIWMSTKISQSSYKKKLNTLKPGDTLRFVGPFGRFTLPSPPPDRIVMLAGGIGITPFRSLAKTIHSHNLPTITTLIHASRGEHLYKKEMDNYVNKAVYATSKTFEESVALAVKDNGVKKALYYISGPPAFIEATQKMLKQKGVRKIRTDAFVGY